MTVATSGILALHAILQGVANMMKGAAPHFFELRGSELVQVGELDDMSGTSGNRLEDSDQGSEIRMRPEGT